MLTLNIYVEMDGTRNTAEVKKKSRRCLINININIARFDVFTTVKIPILLGCDAVWCCGRLPTFRRIMLYPTTTLHGVTTQRNSTWIHI